jgi:transglutaminase-like putative cysteine protease
MRTDNARAARRFSMFDRRTFIGGASALAGYSLLRALGPEPARASADPRASADANASWRSFEIEVELTPQVAGGPLQLWLPLPSSRSEQRLRSLRYSAPGAADVAQFLDPVYTAPMLFARYADGAVVEPLRLRFGVETRDVAVDLSAARALRTPEPDPSLALYLAPTKHVPIDGIVKATCDRVTSGASTPLERARAIYDWIVDNTFRDPKVKGCGTGDIRFMLESGNLSGKCADLNGLFVGLARAAGIPAREVYGLRVARSRIVDCLGTAGDVSKAQHCRAEFHLAGVGWVPVDPADVRKAVLEGGISLSDAKCKALRERLFGSWEMNWIVYNHARDFALPEGPPQPLNYLMYPEAIAGSQRLDGVDPSRFAYQIRSTEV